MEALGQNVENEFMVSLIRSKLPGKSLPKLKKIKNWRTSGPRQILQKNWRNTCQLKNLKIDWLNWIEKGVTLKRNKKKPETSEHINNMMEIITISSLDYLLLKKLLKGCMNNVESNTGVINAINILISKVENL